MKKIAVGLVIAALAVPALAEQEPVTGARDGRVRNVAYDPANVVKVPTADLRSTLLQFNDDETVDLVAIGDMAAWSWDMTRNLVFIRPAISPPRPTNAQVVTLRKDGVQRIYNLYLTSTEAAAFAINFTYPNDVAEARRKTNIERTQVIEAEKAKSRLKTEYFMGKRNWAYVGRGSSSITPAEVSDNGNTTVFRFPGQTKQPAIYVLTPDGKEQIASVTNDDDVAIAHTTAKGWRFRMGDEVAELWNVGFNPVGERPRTGTTSPEVVRFIKASR